jgi:hypothetical protein
VTLTMHVLPVGLSLLVKAEQEPSPLKKLRAALKPTSITDTADPDRLVSAELARHTDPATRQLDLDAVLTPEQQECVRQGGPKLCAEWTSVAVEKSRPGSSGGRGAWVLIASDTDDGLRSAVLVAAQYAPQRRIHYLHEPIPVAPGLVIEPGEVYVFRIPGLDFENNAMTDTTWFSLGAVGHVIQQTASRASAGRWDVLLHLTGGYKAMLPYLLVMAEGIQTVFMQAGSVTPGLEPALRAVSVHEHHPDAPLNSLKQVPLPIRWVEGQPLCALRQLKEHTTNNARVFGDQWREWQGQWVEAGGAKLSRTGMIITRVL